MSKYPAFHIRENRASMLFKKKVSCLTLLLLLTAISSQGCFLEGIEETFDESNRPGLEYNAAGTYYLVRPWNYEKGYNAHKKYPLLIYLHGSGQAGYLKNLYYMGMGYYGDNDFTTDLTLTAKPYEYKKDVADEFRKTYPCFMFVPQESGVPFNTAKIMGQIEQLKSDYRIDTDRIYIHGFSMGGSAAYSLPAQYYNYNGQMFAGIIRLNGGSVTLPDPVIKKTSVWIMTGSNDTNSTATGREAYAFLKNHVYNSGSEEFEKSHYKVGEYWADTVYLVNGGIEIARKTEYPGVGHILITFPFDDPYVFEWLFSQSLKNR